MWVWVAQGLWWVLSGLLSGFRLGLGMFLGQVLTTVVLAAAGMYFKDFILDFITGGLNFAIQAINSVGLDLPSVSGMFQLLPLPVRQAMTRVDLASSLTIVTTALAMKAFMGMFGIARGAKAAAAAQ